MARFRRATLGEAHPSARHREARWRDCGYPECHDPHLPARRLSKDWLLNRLVAKFQDDLLLIVGRQQGLSLLARVQIAKDRGEDPEASAQVAT